MEQKHAGFWIRLWAFLIDWAIISIVIWIAKLVIENILGLTFTSSLWPYYVSFFIYRLVLPITSLRGTVGKFMMGLVIQKSDGENLSTIDSVGRILAQELSTITFGIGYLMIAFTRKKKGLHDKLANTFVVYKSTDQNTVEL
ncbi:RDD family protein [Gottfriedia sp. NPDC056225]|uniref:RDD family protein n=1 Tax=Gottfriedia sp. NPDC056225 TaxID=3345751 RepID=UPI001558BEA2|nr:RDD family protein [Arthrobacter citreus]